MRVSLHIKEFSQQVHLGCTASERAIPQEVRFSLSLKYSVLPRVCESDQLLDATCYQKVTEALSEVCRSGEFATIEKLGMNGFEKIKKLLDPSVSLKINAWKVKPPIDGLLGGVEFEISDGA